LSIFNDAVPLVISTLDRLRGRPHAKIVVGGPGVVGIAQQLMERLPELHAVVVGEGESALLSLLAGQANPADVSGIFQREAKGGIAGRGRTPRENLNTIASPAWSWCRGKGYKTVPLSTMRGCPFSCSFCEIVAFMGRRVTRMNITDTVQNLRVAMDAIGSNDVSIVDDTFTVSARHVDAFCDRVTSEEVNARFSMFSRTDTLTERQMALLAAAGCRRIFFGIDSGDDDVLEAITKNLAVDSALRTAKNAAEFFPVTVSFIWGYPFETLDSFCKTLDACNHLLECKSAFPITPQLHILSPSAGTDLYEGYEGELVFDGEGDSLMLSGTTSRFDADRCGEVLNVIKNEPLLAAPFYRYPTPSFSEKQLLAGQFDKAVQRAVGDRIIGAMRKAKGRDNAA
jgi:radical SAM superfamily enzyme YgiQ (UPF0313 family)